MKRNSFTPIIFMVAKSGLPQTGYIFWSEAVPTYSPTKIVRTIKSITAKEIFRCLPELLGGRRARSVGVYRLTFESKNLMQ